MTKPINRCVPIALLCALGWAGAAQAQVVICHPSANVSAADVKDIFLGDKQLSGSTKLVPVDNASQQEAFLAKFIHIEAAKYGNAWTKKAFREGISAPAVKGSDAEVIEFVKRTPGAVGYVKTAPAGVTVVAQ